MAESALKKIAHDLQYNYSSLQDEKMNALKDSRAATEQTARSQAEALRKDVVYAKHVLRYAGQAHALSDNFGFGYGASSFYGKGTVLTGID